MDNCQKTHLCSVILTCSARNKGISYDNLSEKIGHHGMIGTITGSCHTRTINEIAAISPPGSQYNWVSSASAITNSTFARGTIPGFEFTNQVADEPVTVATWSTGRGDRNSVCPIEPAGAPDGLENSRGDTSPIQKHSETLMPSRSR